MTEAEPTTEALTPDQIEALRWVLMKAIETVSEERWCATWMGGIEKELHTEGGRWETVGRLVGWPVGDYEEWTWMPWDDASAVFHGGAL